MTLAKPRNIDEVASKLVDVRRMEQRQFINDHFSGIDMRLTTIDMLPSPCNARQLAEL